MFKTKIGHVHLKVRNLQKAVDFYTEFLNLKVVERINNSFVFLSGGDAHHEVALQTIGEDAPIPSPSNTGLFHVAFEVPDKKAFALAYAKLTSAGIGVQIVDYKISWAMYFSDPDYNGVEIYVDTRKLPDGREFWHGINTPLRPETILSLI